jgi:hypothetical protein
MRKKLKTRIMVLATFAMSIGIVSNASAQQAATSKAKADDQYTYVPFAGQKVAIDRQTGKLRPPTPEEVRTLTQGLKTMLSRSDQGLTVVRHPNGMQSVNLQGRFQSVALVKINSDGNASEQCVTNEQEAKQFLTSENVTTKSADHSTKKESAAEVK